MAFVIPTIFSAIDQYSSKVAVMGRNTMGFANKLEAVNARSDRFFNKMLPGRIATATSTLLSYGEAALVTDGVLKTGKGIMDYNTEIANLSAVTGATGSHLKEFEKDILSVARVTKRSSVEVAQAFTNVDNNLPQYHQNAAALAEVTKQSIILAKASRMELAPSAEYLTMDMNQFGLKANQAAMAVDVLSAGAVAGSSRIAETSEALQNFGAAAANVAKISFAESVGLVELGSKFEKGSEEGTHLRNILLNLTNIKINPAARLVRSLGVDLNKVSNTSLPLIERLQEIKKISGNPIAMEKVFEKRNVALASGMLSVLDNYSAILAAENKLGVGERMAATNTDTLAESAKQLAAAWQTEITASNSVGIGVTVLKDSFQFLTNHMEGIVNILGIAVPLFVGFKGVLYATRIATTAYSFAQGIAMGVTGEMTTAVANETAALKGLDIGLMYAEDGLMAFLGPVGLVAGAIGLLAAAFGEDYKQEYNALESQGKLVDGYRQLAKPITDAAIAQKQYNEAMDDYNELLKFKRVEDYEYKKSWLRGAWFDVKNSIQHPILAGQDYFSGTDTALTEKMYKPQFQNFPGLDTTAVLKAEQTYNSDTTAHSEQSKQAQQSTDGKTSYNNEKPDVNVYLNIQKDGTVTADGANVTIFPYIGSTFKNQTA